MTDQLRPLLVVWTALIAAGCNGDIGSDDPGATAPECQLDSKSEKSPGYPFDVDKFGTEVMPVISKSCATAGCHAAPTGNAGFTVWAAAKPGDCDFAKTFNSVVAKVDLATPSNSRFIAVISGGSTTHPFTFQPTAPELATLRGFVETAAATYAADGGGSTPPPGPSPFDYKVYQSTIQPMLERCSGGACHGGGQGGFTVKAMPAAGSADMQANFIAVTSRTNLVTPASSLIYTRATVQHASGASKTVDSTQAAALIAWIEDAKKNAGSNPNPTCAPIDKFNAGVFASEVVPILSGDLDLNSPTGQALGAGCRSAACHGIDRGPGKLSMPATADTATLLQNFACFVNLASPAASEILACPLNNPGCRSYPHPGQDVLGGANDLNYQRMLAYVYGANAATSPLDFAFFSRRINPILNDPNSVEAGAQGRSCSDATSCHGISVAGQSAPNGSDFAVIANASGLDRLTFNFVSATGFVNFLSPRGSSLFMYPTNEIANRADNPFATGIPHPGGADFAVDSVEAQAILQWAAGLRPDANGFLRNWLVVGDFPATQIIDPTLIDEPTAIPKIFDRGGGAFNRGEWDGLFSDAAEVDLNTAFPRNTGGRVAYATAYAINTVPRTLRVQLTVATDNPIRIYIDGQLIAQNVDSGGTSAFFTLGPSGTAKPIRIMLKILQRDGDARFAFTARLRDELGTLLTENTRELVFTLGPNGGI
ncbi:MAG TPA: hypothetical protein VIV40_32240 [Kofleriaceae bacterium]